MQIKELYNAALFNEDGEVLVLSRAGVYQGQLEFPGGKKEGYTEGYKKTLKRECVEELGTDVCLAVSQKPYRPFYASGYTPTLLASDFFTNPRTQASYIRNIALGFLSKEKKIQLSSEHESFEWMTLEMILEEKTQFAPGYTSLFAQMQRGSEGKLDTFAALIMQRGKRVRCEQIRYHEGSGRFLIAQTEGTLSHSFMVTEYGLGLWFSGEHSAIVQHKKEQRTECDPQNILVIPEFKEYCMTFSSLSK